jgi:hypothetical protein
MNQTKLDVHYDKSRFPEHLICQHCNDERFFSGEIEDNSLADCPGCDTTCCDACYEQYHTSGPCLSNIRWTKDV